MSTNPHSFNTSMKSIIKNGSFGSPPLFSFWSKISLKSPLHSHGNLNNEDSRRSKFHVCTFWATSGCPYIPVYLYHFPFLCLTIASIWWLLQEVIWRSISLFHIIANPPLIPALLTVKQQSKFTFLLTSSIWFANIFVSHKKTISGLFNWRSLQRPRIVRGFPKPRTFQLKIFMAVDRAVQQPLPISLQIQQPSHSSSLNSSDLKQITSTRW